MNHHPYMASVALLLTFAMLAGGAAARPAVPALYVFGDSLVDVGNNDYLTGANVPKVNFTPYGIDFPGSTPTGRYSNGYNLADFVARHLGLRLSPPAYLSISATPEKLPRILRGLGGVSFAAGGSGVLNTTGSTITMAEQIVSFAAMNISSPDLLAKSVAFISAGANDIFAFAAANRNASTSQVAAFYGDLISNYTHHITNLYLLGVRKLAILEAVPLGCVPSARLLNSTGGCAAGLNQLAVGFNAELGKLLADLSSKLEGLKYSVGGFNIITELLAGAAELGYTDAGSACCGVPVKNGTQIACLPGGSYCGDRKRFVFWDGIHPTQKTARLGAAALYRGPISFVKPVNFKQLVHAR